MTNYHGKFKIEKPRNLSGVYKPQKIDPEKLRSGEYLIVATPLDEYTWEGIMHPTRKDLIDTIKIYGPSTNNPTVMHRYFPLGLKTASPQEIKKIKEKFYEGQGLHSLLKIRSVKEDRIPTTEEISKKCEEVSRERVSLLRNLEART